eukprot:4932352-Amphidinium_carterae.3
MKEIHQGSTICSFRPEAFRSFKAAICSAQLKVQCTSESSAQCHSSNPTQSQQHLFTINRLCS